MSGKFEMKLIYNKNQMFHQSQKSWELLAREQTAGESTDLLFGLFWFKQMRNGLVVKPTNLSSL